MRHKAGKGSKPRPADLKKFNENYPKITRKVEGFVLKKGKQTKKY
jgi:hypothetical protein